MDLAYSLRSALALATPATTPQLFAAIDESGLPASPLHQRITLAPRESLPGRLRASYAFGELTLSPASPRAFDRVAYAAAIICSAVNIPTLLLPTAPLDVADQDVLRGFLWTGTLLFGDEPLHEAALRESAALAEWGQVPEGFARAWLLYVPWERASQRAWQRRLDVMHERERCAST